MRFLALNVTRFGALAERDFPLDRQVVIVHGPNEAGKSSFHGALETCLYGFSPASRDLHPYTRWDDATRLELAAELERDDGSRLAVERTLRATPGTRLAESLEALAGPRRGNNPLPGLEPFPRALFRAVYSLTANDTTFQTDEVRQHVSELLLGERGLEGARPALEVRQRLAEEVAGLWRPDERGKPRARALRAELREARKAAREARRRERELREEEEEHTALLAEGEELSSRRDALRREQEETAFLAAVAELRARMDRARPLRTDSLGPAGMEDPAPLARELDALRAELEAPRARLAAAPPRLELGDRMLLERAEQVEAVAREAPRREADLERRGAAAERAGRAERAARERAARAGLPAYDLASLAELDLAALEDAVGAWREAVARRTGEGAGATAARASLGLALLCVALAALGVTPPWVALGALLAVPAVLRRDRDGRGAPTPAEVGAAVAVLGLEPVDSPADLERLLADLEDARARAREARREQDEVARLEASLREREERWRRAARGLVEADASTADLPRRLEEDLARARRREAECRRAREQRAHDERHVEASAARERRLAERLATVNAALEEHFGHLEPEARLQAWREAEGELDYVRRRERELRDDPRWPSLADDPRLEVGAGEEPPWSDAARAARDEELERIDRRLQELGHRQGRIGAHLDDDAGSDVAEAAERERELERELASVLRERDRLALLQRLLVVAERAHREAHQPDVLQRASEYLARITGERYLGLHYPDGDDENLHVQPADRDEGLPVGVPLSRGTREQIYLCLRLGTLDDLDRERERLPLVLDEALVHWDAGRRAALYPVLERVAERRQVILFTCHPELAREAEEALAAPVVDLAGPVGQRAG